MAGRRAPLPHRPPPDFSSAVIPTPPSLWGSPGPRLTHRTPHRTEPGPGAPGWKGPGFPLALPHTGPPPAPALGSPRLGRTLLCPRAVASSRAFPHGPPPRPGGCRGPLQALERAPDGGPSAALSSSEDTPICLLGRRPPPPPPPPPPA